MKRIFITGSTGFIGNNLLSYLALNKKYKIYLINRSGVTKKEKNIYYFKYDGKITNLINFFKLKKPDLVIHLATNFISNHKEKQISEEGNIGRLIIMIGIFSFLEASILA